jgi:hypothetical protein
MAANVLGEPAAFTFGSNDGGSMFLRKVHNYPPNGRVHIHEDRSLNKHTQTD